MCPAPVSGGQARGTGRTMRVRTFAAQRYTVRPSLQLTALKIDHLAIAEGPSGGPFATTSQMSPRDGSCTTLTKKWSICLMASMKPSKSTGLVT